MLMSDPPDEPIMNDPIIEKILEQKEYKGWRVDLDRSGSILWFKENVPITLWLTPGWSDENHVPCDIEFHDDPYANPVHMDFEWTKNGTWENYVAILDPLIQVLSRVK